MNGKIAFEEYLAAAAKMPRGERQAKMQENMKLCICARCPTYMGRGEKRLLFCLAGKSKIIKAEAGCICPGCPVQGMLGLKWTYYCTRGSGKERGGMK